MSVFKSRIGFLPTGISIALLAICVIQFMQHRAYVDADIKRRQKEIKDVLYRPIVEVEITEERHVPDEVAYRNQYDFTSDWFSANIPVWEKVLEPYRHQPDVQYLEVGLYEGRSSIWALENILTHSTARMTGVDIFSGETERRYRANMKLSGASDKVTTIKGYSQEVLRNLPLNNYDIIYIDGSHFEDDVLEDAVLSWRLLKDNGILIFDDYRWYRTSEGKVTKLPRAAIDPFVRCFADQCEVLHVGYQLILRKKPRADAQDSNLL